MPERLTTVGSALAPSLSSPRPARTVSPQACTRAESNSFGFAVVACKRCHHRKKKCDRAKPACASCVRSRVGCVYVGDTVDTPYSYSSDLLVERIADKERIAQLEHKVASLESSLSQTINSVSIGAPGPIESVGFLFSSLPTTDPASRQINIPAGSEPTFAERIVWQVLTTELDHRETGLYLRSCISQLLGISREPEEEEYNSGAGENMLTQDVAFSPTGKTTLKTWPPLVLAEKLVHQFFTYGGGIYPVVERVAIEHDLKTIYALTAPETPTVDTCPIPDGRVYRLFMVFTIGCYMLEDRNSKSQMDSTPLRTFAFHHFPAVLRENENTCLSGIILWAICSVLDCNRLNPYAVLRVAGQFAIEFGFHQDKPDLPLAQQDARKNLFWSLFCLDRTISALFVKPVVIPDSVITICMPRTLSHSFGNLMSYMDPETSFHHMILVRRLHGNRPARSRDGDQVLLRLRNQIDDWLQSVPTPPSPGPRYHELFELYYSILLTALYRPSPLFAHTSPRRLPTLRKAASRGIQLYCELHAANRMSQNYVHYHHIVTLSLALVYTLLESEGDPQNLEISSWRRDAVREISDCEQLLSTFCAAWPGSAQFRKAFGDHAAEVKTRLMIVEPFVPSIPPQFQPPTDVTSSASVLSTIPDIAVPEEVTQQPPTTHQVDMTDDQAWWNQWTDVDTLQPSDSLLRFDFNMPW
ncbi:hypothetical protein BCR39DRAFT_599621 [Naematelia encephala]|uniref:Zn(2)-C6 fungal-type domain-containing protein n=1 Tax=Naematelia encephala TaxID=71784 RepID=A0A1Y2AWC7_9TREE|nr:hypothetical protein BCR39DRAFT_599621 [Naematelia encephala]